MDNIISHIHLATCKENGYTITKGKQKKYPSGRYRSVIQYKKGRTFAGSQKKKNNTKTTTVQPTDAKDKCTFNFPVFFDNGTEWFYVRRNGGNCWKHCKHCLENSEIMHDGKKDVPEDKLKTVQSLLEADIPPSMVNKTGINLSDDSMKAIRHSVMIEKFKGENDTGERTAA